jgi:uncharacterized protein (DUF1778 family)
VDPVSDEAVPSVPSRTKAEANSTRTVDSAGNLIGTVPAIACEPRNDLTVETTQKLATESSLDTRSFQLDREQTVELAAQLANPPGPGPELRMLMRTKAPWE